MEIYLFIFYVSYMRVVTSIIYSITITCTFKKIFEGGYTKKWCWIYLETIFTQ